MQGWGTLKQDEKNELKHTKKNKIKQSKAKQTNKQVLCNELIRRERFILSHSD